MPKAAHKVVVIGHRNPDTDSICSAIAYAELKNKTSDLVCEPRRAGKMNQETEFVLKKFGVKPPRMCTDVNPKIRDVDYREMPGIPGSTSLRKAWEIMRDKQIDTLPVTSADNELEGVITVKDIATANMDVFDTGILAKSRTSFRNILETLDGTMAVGSDFRRFKTQAGLEKGHRVMESVSPSPFDYRNNCLLYLPQIPPRQRVEDTDVYFNELTAELVGLIKAATGHALVLFTSYAAMSAVKERLWEESLPFPLLTLGRNAPHIIEQFRHTPGAVLLATGAAWEGFDFPGDCVSLLIIPRLPFAYPDARKERELEKYPSLHAFIREVAVPEMQIKLRQGFGRAIRTESDTCVIAILDERACRGRRYAQAVSEALPEMRRTGSLREVTRFLREKKPESYFEVGR